MDKDTEKKEAVKDTAEGTNLVELSKPYAFEGKEYTQIDLGGLDRLTIGDAVNAQKQLLGEGEIATMILAETTTAFARLIACKATGMPIEFFKLMPRSASKKVTNTIHRYMNTESRTENHVMAFEEPYVFEGKEYTKVDLNGLADMTSMNESEAENRMTREGMPVTETQYNYLYACIMAGMATGHPTEFFTGLPFKETLKLKTAVNDPDFFE